MFFSKTSVLITLAYLASPANADCVTDITSDEWAAFYTDLTGASYDFTKFPQDCLDLGGDVFTYSGTTTCNGDVTQHVRDPSCVPVSCTASGNEALLSAVLATDEGCTGDYTFEGLGDGTPSSVQCILIDMPALDGQDSTKLEAFIAARFIGEAMGGDYSAFPPLCDVMEDTHYFTFNGTQTCDDATMNKDVTGVPMCLPESCTDGDEATLADMVTAVEEGIYQEGLNMSCTVSGLTFDLKEEEHDSHDSHDSHNSHDSHDGHDHGDETSGAFSPAATSVITAGVATIVTGLAAAF